MASHSGKRSHKTVEAPPMPTKRRIYPSGLTTNPVLAIQAELSIHRSGLTFAQIDAMICSGKAIGG